MCPYSSWASRRSGEDQCGGASRGGEPEDGPAKDTCFRRVGKLSLAKDVNFGDAVHEI